MMDDERQEGKSQEKDKQAEAQPKHTSNTGWGSPSSGAKGGDDAPHKEKDKTTTAINSTTAVEDDDEPKGRRKNLRDMEEDQETELIMMIPDLDEDESEDITLQVAAAPRNLARRLPSLQQVET
jgi:hypothetical protein